MSCRCEEWADPCKRAERAHEYGAVSPMWRFHCAIHGWQEFDAADDADALTAELHRILAAVCKVYEVGDIKLIMCGPVARGEDRGWADIEGRRIKLWYHRRDTLRHELAHFVQHDVLGYECVTIVDAHGPEFSRALQLVYRVA